MDIRTILVPVDFSTCSALVAREASDLAASLAARMILFHVAEIPGGMSPKARVPVDGEILRAEDYVTRDARARLAPMAEGVRQRGVDVEIEVTTGPIVSAIVDAAAEADLVMLGTHGRTGLARMLLGSVAEEVVRHASAPVMLIRREPRPECHRDSCSWCDLGDRSPAERRLEAEMEG